MATPNTSKSNGIRKRPAYQVMAQLRRAGVTQTAIAEKLGISQSTVSAAILRRRSLIAAATIERVWVEIERSLEAPAKV
jgi:predicted transcriptional regulator